MGILLPSVCMVLRVVALTEKVGYVLVHVFSLVPTFSAIWGSYIIASMDTYEKAYYHYHKRHGNFKEFDWGIGLQPLVFLAISGPLYMALLFLWELKLKWVLRNRERNVAMPRYEYQHETDSDVAKEEARIRQEFGKLSISVSGISKVYPAKMKGAQKFLAVHQVSFGVNKGEVFGLLGANGAGKTTVFKILTNALTPNTGAVHTSPNVGYCPQPNVLFAYLTVREHFELYAAIKGIPRKCCREIVEELCKSLGLEEYLEVQTWKLSGGTRRKLSVALGVLGNPPVILLDEPSTGIDPLARRQMWDLIGRVAHRSAVVLTTHSMEEAEALSTKLAIMVNGTIRCIGPVQYIKSKFATGFCVEIKFLHPTDNIVEGYAKERRIAKDLNQSIDYKELLKLLRDLGLRKFADNITATGECADLYWTIKSAQGISLLIALKYAIVEEAKVRLWEYLSEYCGETRVEFVVMGHYKYRVKDSKVSVGKLFGMVEAMVILLGYM